MKKNFKLTIEYDGSAYHGWQRQSTRPTIQGTIENALKTMTGKQVTLIGSGRTDAGVHACGQIANFLCETRLTPEIFQKGLNSLLPKDIVIKACSETSEQFNARYDVKSKTYHYRMLNRDLPDAIGRQYAWHIPQKLDLNAMNRACKHIIGTHDFKSFEGTGSPRTHTQRCIIQAHIVEKDAGYLVFEIEGDGFLKFMVRNIVGTLVYVGRGKILCDDVQRILQSQNRKLAGPTAPAKGLFLVQVTY